MYIDVKHGTSAPASCSVQPHQSPGRTSESFYTLDAVSAEALGVRRAVHRNTRAWVGSDLGGGRAVAHRNLSHRKGALGADLGEGVCYSTAECTLGPQNSCLEIPL